MGKAIVFNGVAVTTPIQTVNFVVPLVTGQDYVNQYSLLATEVTEPQKGHLATFIDTLIANSLWDKVHKCYPMLGGMNGYKFDCKDLKNQVNWSLPPLGTTWDAVRNAPYTNPIGLDYGTDIPVPNLVETDFCVIYNAKQKDDTPRYPCTLMNTATTGISLVTKQGGARFPLWNTPTSTTSLANYLPVNSNSFILNYRAGTNSFKVKSLNSPLSDALTPATLTQQVISIRLWGVFLASMAAPANSANYGNTNMAVIFNTGLTDAEIGIVADAIYTFNQNCGRNTAW